MTCALIYSTDVGVFVSEKVKEMENHINKHINQIAENKSTALKISSYRQTIFRSVSIIYRKIVVIK